VLNRRAPEHDYVKSPAEFAWLPGAREGVRRLNREGWLVLVVTNQRGVARGLMTAQDWNVDLAVSFLVGDDERDVLAAERAGVRAYRMPTDGDLAQTLARILGPA